MLLLHTSDLHLGRSFHGRSLRAEQEAVHDRLLRICRERSVDAVLISGDVYDQASPRTEVIQQLSRLLESLHELGVRVILTSGNHDSTARLSFAAPVLRAGGIHLITEIEQITQPVSLGQSPAGEELLVYGIPYLLPRHAAGVLGTEPTHQAVLAEAVRRIQEDRQGRGQHRAVVMAHCFAAGGQSTHSERSLEQGGLEAVSPRVFEDVDYAALGHLHGRQRLSPTIRYSGSPLPFSFAEAEQVKGCWLLRFEEDLEVEEVLWDEHVRLARLTGSLQELLESPEYAWAEERWCQITLTDTERPAHPMERLRTRFPHTLQLKFSGLPQREGISYAKTVAAAEKDPVEACAAFYDRVRRRPLDEEERAELASVVRAASARLEDGERA